MSIVSRLLGLKFHRIALNTGRPVAPCVCGIAAAIVAAIAASIGSVTVGGSAIAAEPDPSTPTSTKLEAAPVLTKPACDTPANHQFDFWLGEWQVYDATNNTLIAFDRVEKHSEGCIVQQNMNFLTDMYRRPGAGYRLAGISVNRYDGEAWMEMWADNQWGAIALRGAPDEHSAMVLKTITPSRHRDLKLIWEKQADGSVRILQYVAPEGSGKWEKYGDLIYRRNH